MPTSKPLKILLSLSLSAATLQAYAEQKPAPADQPAESAQSAQSAERPAAESEDLTWFGMGFESRQERFRRDMEAAVPGINGGSGSAGASGAGGGQGGGQGGGK